MTVGWSFGQKLFIAILLVPLFVMMVLNVALAHPLFPDAEGAEYRPTDAQIDAFLSKYEGWDFYGVWARDVNNNTFFAVQAFPVGANVSFWLSGDNLKYRSTLDGHVLGTDGSQGAWALVKNTDRVFFNNVVDGRGQKLDPPLPPPMVTGTMGGAKVLWSLFRQIVPPVVILLVGSVALRKAWAMLLTLLRGA